MPERPDLRKIAGEIREAVETYPKEALVDILTYVFQAYVVEGAAPLVPTQPDRLVELEGLTFPEVIQSLQARLDVPELSLFEVSAGRVHVRIGTELVPLVGGRTPGAVEAPPQPAPAARSAPSAARPPLTGPSAPPSFGGGPAGVSVVEVPTRPAPANVAPVEAPRPTRGLSVNPAGAPRPPTTPAQQQAAPVAPTRPAQAASSDEPSDDDAASKRFRLLEID